MFMLKYLHALKHFVLEIFHFCICCETDIVNYIFVTEDGYQNNYNENGLIYGVAQSQGSNKPIIFEYRKFC